MSRFYTPEDTDIPTIDRTRKTAVIIRRSPIPNQELSRHLQEQQQEQLVTFAKLVRGEETEDNLLLYTQDGAPASQGQTTCLQEDIASGCIRSIIAERPDRLFRNTHALITTLLPKQHIIVLVPGKRVYDFSKEEDLKAFQATY